MKASKVYLGILSTVSLLCVIQLTMNRKTCVSPETMDDTDLRQTLIVRNVSATGARQTLIHQYFKSDPRM